MDVIMPQLGETVAEGTVTRWYKKVGEPVKADEALFDVETDKVSTEIPAPVNGVLAEIVVAEGVTAKVGARLAVIRESGVATAASAAPSAQPVARGSARRRLFICVRSSSRTRSSSAPRLASPARRRSSASDSCSRDNASW